MRRAVTKRGGTDYSSRKFCKACVRPIDVCGRLSRRGMCEACGVAHMVAQRLGMSSVYYEIASINDGLRFRYAGKVNKVA
jgi:hypothetical protein